MNPCPCGYYGDPVQECTCSNAMVSRYQKRISGPLLDRIDIHIEVPRVEYEKLSDERLGEPSAAIRKRVEAARARQAARFAGTRMLANADMGPGEVRDYCRLDDAGKSLLKAAMQQHPKGTRQQVVEEQVAGAIGEGVDPFAHGGVSGAVLGQLAHQAPPAEADEQVEGDHLLQESDDETAVGMEKVRQQGVGTAARFAADALDRQPVVCLTGDGRARVGAPADQGAGGPAVGMRALFGDGEHGTVVLACSDVFFDGAGIFEYNDHAFWGHPPLVVRAAKHRRHDGGCRPFWLGWPLLSSWSSVPSSTAGRGTALCAGVAQSMLPAPFKRQGVDLA